MAIKLNDSVRVQGAKPVEDKMLNNGVPYSSVAQAKNTIAKTDRYQSLTVIVNNGTSNEEWWWKDGVEDINLISKFSEEKDTLADVVNRGRISPLPIKFVDGTDLNYIEVGSKAPNNNIWFGNGLSLATTGEGNLAIGYNSLRSITTGNWNNALGGNTLELLQTGRENVAVGDYAGNMLLTGAKNTLLGGSVASYNSSGLYNTMIGYSSNSVYKVGQSPSGNRNTFIGAHSGQGVNGNNNVLIGVLAGKASSSGSGLGTLNNKLVIHSHTGFIGTGGDSEGPIVSLESNLENSLISGDFAERWVKFNGTFTIGPTYIPNADDTYTKNIVAKPDGTFGWEDKVVGQNIANSSLTSVTGAGMTLGAPYTWNAAGQPFYITNLPDKSADSTFTRLKVQNSSGQEAVVTNPYQVLRTSFLGMSAAEALELGQLLNGGAGSAGAMSVNLISPPIVQQIDSIEYILLRGTNLNLNATSKKIEIRDAVTKALVVTIPDSQIQLSSDGLTLIFYYNFKDFITGEFIIRLTSGVKVYDTNLTLKTVLNIDNINLDALTYDIIYASDVTPSSSDVAIGRNVAINTPTGALLGGAIPKVSIKSSEIFAQRDDFYLEFTVNLGAKSSSNTQDGNTSYIGVGYSSTPNALVPSSLVHFNYSYANNSEVDIKNNNIVIANAQQTPLIETIIIIKTGNLFRTIVRSTNHQITLSNNSGYSLFLNIVGRTNGTIQAIQTQIIKAYTFN